jgi:hypothetical protein
MKRTRRKIDAALPPVFEMTRAGPVRVAVCGGRNGDDHTGAASRAPPQGVNLRRLRKTNRIARLGRGIPSDESVV